MLCPRTSGFASNTRASRSESALKSGISSSTPHPATCWWISRQVCAYSQAPPSSRSSLATPVTVAYARPIVATDSATRRGSPVSSAAGLPVSIWQKSQRLVHWSPPMRKVASRSSQHSKMFGHPACSQTVCSCSRRTRSFSAEYCGPVRSRVLIHAGLRSIGVWLLRASSRSIRRPSGASTTISGYVPRPDGVTARGIMSGAARAAPGWPARAGGPGSPPGAAMPGAAAASTIGVTQRCWCPQPGAAAGRMGACHALNHLPGCSPFRRAGSRGRSGASELAWPWPP